MREFVINFVVQEDEDAPTPHMRPPPEACGDTTLALSSRGDAALPAAGGVGVHLRRVQGGGGSSSVEQGGPFLDPFLSAG